MQDDYLQKLSAALDIRQDWIEQSILDKMNAALHTFRSSFSAMYALYLKKGLINEDPYKEETRVNDLIPLKTNNFPETERTEQLSIRLSVYDNQIDFLVNFCQITSDFLTIERIKRILALVKYIDWCHLSTESDSATTRGVAEITNQIRRGTDSMVQHIMQDSIAALNKASIDIISILKTVSDFRRELYKYDVRVGLKDKLPEQGPVSSAQIKTWMAGALASEPFYPDLIEELIKEDYASNSASLQEAVLSSLAVVSTNVVKESEKKKEEPESPKLLLIDGILVLASVAPTLGDIAIKINTNKLLLEHKKVGVFVKLTRLLRQAFNKEPQALIYQLHFVDKLKGITVREEIDFTLFCADMEKKTKNLLSITGRANPHEALEAMPDEKLIGFLEKNIKDIQGLHKILGALDEYFKANIDSDDRSKIRGIKPELATIKNVFVKATQKYHDYKAQKEENEWMKLTK
ncbi:MAG: hypothetical protein LBO67_05020 [Spirochaetaceae bacterium]|nr:hypothetical protein [Spirochaetaceae bacterium]